VWNGFKWLPVESQEELMQQGWSGGEAEDMMGLLSRIGKKPGISSFPQPGTRYTTISQVASKSLGIWEDKLKDPKFKPQVGQPIFSSTFNMYVVWNGSKWGPLKSEAELIQEDGWSPGEAEDIIGSISIMGRKPTLGKKRFEAPKEPSARPKDLNQPDTIKVTDAKNGHSYTINQKQREDFFLSGGPGHNRNVSDFTFQPISL
jgi:hypothetical protein